MSPKIRALIWEELRTSGVIAGWCVMVTTLCLLTARMTEGWENMYWEIARPVALPLSLLPLVLLTLLLLYRTGNSGNLSGGYSGRVLLLPVETRHLASLTLFLRATLLGGATFAVLCICRALFLGHGPGWVLLLLFPAFYFAIQVVDWLRCPNPLLACIGLLPTLAIPTIVVLQVTIRGGRLDDTFLPWNLCVLIFLGTGLIAYWVSIYAVGRSRRGARVTINLRFQLPEALPLPIWSANHGFRSPRWALVWGFLRKDGLLLPIWTLTFGALLLFGLLAWVYLVPEKTEQSSMLGFGVLQFASWFLLPLAAMLWGAGRAGAGLQRGVRPILTEYLYPMSAAELAATRLWGHGLVLGVTWGCALLVSNAGFFLTDDALAWRIWMSSLAAGESSLREMVSSQLALPLMTLLAAWALMVIRTRLVAWLMGLTVVYATTAMVSLTYYQDDNPQFILLLPLSITLAATIALIVWTSRSRTHTRWLAVAWLLPYGLAVFLGTTYSGTNPNEIRANLICLAIALLIAVTISALLWCWRRGVMPARHAAGCALTWIAVVLFTYPYGHWQLSGMDRTALLYGIAMGALVVLPYPALLLDLHRRRHHDDTPIATGDHIRPTCWNVSPVFQRVGFALLAALVIGGVWLRWPARPAFIATLRAQGMPATPADLAELYGSVPGEENAAPHFLKVVQEKRSYDADWYAWLGEQRDSAENTDAEIIYHPKGPVINGIVDLAPDKPLWDKYGELAQVYHEKVSAPTTAALIEVASAGYPRSHYPIDLGSGAQANVSVLSDIRDLARAQSYEVWIAAMEDRPQDALNAIVSMGALAESLREEPMLISQLVRIAIHGIMNSAIEQALSRTEFSESQLAELQGFLSNVLPASDETGMIAQALIGERTFMTSFEGGDFVLESGINAGLATSQPWFLRFTRVVYLRCLAEILEEPRNRTTNFTAEIEESSNPLYILPKIAVPGLDRARDAEWRCRVSIDMAATACAVERHRLKYGTLPVSLEVLVPEYLASIPTDPFRDDRGPVSYRISEDGSYVLYSWAGNRTDEGGVNQYKGRSKSNQWLDGDWIFSVAPLTFRNGPQLTDIQPLEEEDEPAPLNGGRRLGPQAAP